MPDEKTIYGIIGSPLTHSLSPLMHNAAFQELGVNAEYKLFPLEEAELGDFFAGLKEKSSPIFGLNVTVPYKEKIIPYLDALTPLVQRIMAVNTIVVTKDRKLVGHNTDAPGFLSHLVELRFNTREKNIAILGAGGSARALLTALCMIPERPQVVKLYNRTEGRLKELTEDLSTRMDTSIVQPVLDIEEIGLRETDLLINTTSVGLKRDDPCLIEQDLLHGDMLVYDLIYNPKETLLLKMAREQGARTANGLGMLFYQGVLAFQHWANVQLDDRTKQKMREALESGVK